MLYEPLLTTTKMTGLINEAYFIGIMAKEKRTKFMFHVNLYLKIEQVLYFRQRDPFI